MHDARHFDKIFNWVKGTSADLLEYIKGQLTHTGFADYQHSGGPVALAVDTWTDVPNDQQGPYTSIRFLPPGISTLMDPATGYLDFTSLHLGDWVSIRNDFTVTPDAPNSIVSARYLLGSNGQQFSLDIFELTERGGSSPAPSQKGDIRITMSFLDTINGPGKLQVKCSSGGTLQNNGSNIAVTLSTPHLRGLPRSYDE